MKCNLEKLVTSYIWQMYIYCFVDYVICIHDVLADC